MNDVQVLIVGAGPTGLTLACDLVRRGIRVRIVEQRPGPQDGSRGFSLKPRSLEALDDLGVADRIAEAAQVQSRLRFHLGEALLFDLRVPPAPASSRRSHPNVVALPQWRTEAVLRDRLAELGGAVEFGCQLTDHRSDDDGVTASLVHGDTTAETLRVDYLVGTDGGRSLVRRRLGLSFEGSTDEDARAILADVHVSGLEHPQAVHLWMVAGGHILALRPTPHAETWQAVASIQPDGTGTWPEASLANLQQAVTERTGRPDIALSNPTWLSAWRYNLRMVNRYRVGRVLLAGDAAHVHSPFGAFGMNTGIQDAHNLGWKLALVIQTAAAESLLDSYETERLPVARAALRDSDQRFSATTPPRALRPLLRFIIKPVLARQQRSDRTDHPTYRTSPLSLHLAGFRSGVHAGDPAPDGQVKLAATGADTRLSDLFRGPHFTILSFGVTQATAANDTVRDHHPHLHAYTIAPATRRGAHHTPPPTLGVPVLTDHSGTVRRTYGGHDDTIIVVRPDGYLGLVAHRPTRYTLRDYLRHAVHLIPSTEPTTTGSASARGSA